MDECDLKCLYVCPVMTYPKIHFLRELKISLGFKIKLLWTFLSTKGRRAQLLTLRRFTMNHFSLFYEPVFKLWMKKKITLPTSKKKLKKNPKISPSKWLEHREKLVPTAFSFNPADQTWWLSLLCCVFHLLCTKWGKSKIWTKCLNSNRPTLSYKTAQERPHASIR